jgi:hypothetical protein
LQIIVNIFGECRRGLHGKNLQRLSEFKSRPLRLFYEAEISAILSPKSLEFPASLFVELFHPVPFFEFAPNQKQHQHNERRADEKEYKNDLKYSVHRICCLPFI